MTISDGTVAAKGAIREAGSCGMCVALAAMLETPPWLLSGAMNSARAHETWCHRRAVYQMYNPYSQFNAQLFSEKTRGIVIASLLCRVVSCRGRRPHRAKT
ncbi:hypothetical protein DPMN_150580 [Dreissena polymorpha]|uniref:Uncharacterized protein n=1 Tax=Dreissena polymorpha TaxID=45954 RepID=A0A9D4FDK2_DREPO|nr:hypothetical protein DPMN_150580 [Dreissena polymorpha]